MTREEILEQAKVGEYAVVRVKIANAFVSGEYEGRIIPEFKRDDYGVAYILPDDVISIEPPPKSDAEKLADALAEIVRVNRLLNDRYVGRVSDD